MRRGEDAPAAARSEARTEPPPADGAWPIVARKDHGAPSVFQPAALLREARRQKGLPLTPVPDVCILDPDGDIVRHLRHTGTGQRHAGWPGYHTELFTFELTGVGTAGIIGCAVGASFAVLIAEQLFASGCKLLVSVTSAGQLAELGPTPYFVLIDRALRDEGTSYHYLPPSIFSEAPDPSLIARVQRALAARKDIVVHRGASWTTDAPYRETQSAIEAAQAHGALAVEMESAALYAFGTATGHPVLCLAYVTNTMAQSDGDFEKGESEGAALALEVIATAAAAWRATSCSAHS